MPKEYTTYSVHQHTTEDGTKYLCRAPTSQRARRSVRGSRTGSLRARGAMSSNWRGGSTASWKKVRAAVLLRDGYRCQLQLPGTCVGTATHVHHTQDRSVVGDDPMYLIAACARCNTSYGSPLQAKYGDPPARPRTRW